MKTQTKSQRLYLDYASTWPMRHEVWEAMSAELAQSFNPASSHGPGRQAHRSLELARAKIGKLLGCTRAGIYFTGGGTQSDNLAILGFARAHAGENPRIFVSEIEHKACTASAEQASAEQARVSEVPVDSSGTVNLGWLERKLASDPKAPTLVSIMWANNEIGTVQPMSEIVDISHANNAIVHTDAVQALSKINVNIEQTPVDLLSATAHKLGGPVGIGILYCRPGIRLEPLSYGGGQERSMWPGTQNPLGAIGFTAALALALEGQREHVAHWEELRYHLESRVLSEIPGARIHGHDAKRRLPHIVSVGIPGCDSGAILVSLDLEGIAVSGGSACGSDSGLGSSVLDALGLDVEPPYATIRFSFGTETSRLDIDRAVDALVRIAGRVHSLSV